MLCSVSYVAVNFLNPEVIFLYCQLRYECSATLGTGWQCLSRIFSAGSISLYRIFTGWLVYLGPHTCIQIHTAPSTPNFQLLSADTHTKQQITDSLASLGGLFSLHSFFCKGACGIRYPCCIYLVIKFYGWIQNDRWATQIEGCELTVSRRESKTVALSLLSSPKYSKGLSSTRSRL